MFVYLRSEPGLYTAGHYNPAGDFVAESDHDTEDGAAQRAAFLNGAAPATTDNVVSLWAEGAERREFAKCFLAALFARPGNASVPDTVLAKQAVGYADALLLELAKPREGVTP